MQRLRTTAGVLASLMLFGITGCTPTVNSASRNDYPSTPTRRQEQPRQGMSTRNKVLLLAGAAALYYMYQKHKDKQGQGPEGQYYRSKNGRIYYRDKKGNPVWVTEPREPIAVSPQEYERYTGRRVDDYDGRVIREAPAGW